MKSFQFILPVAGVLAMGLAGCQTQNAGNSAAPAATRTAKPVTATTTPRTPARVIVPRESGG
ncbi:MAG: hypothetical protein ABJG32_07710, partial [Roseibium sp.]